MQETKQLLERIRQAPEATALKPIPEAAPPEPQTPVPAVELTPEALGQFTHKVQPILMNACASCHAQTAAAVPSSSRKSLTCPRSIAGRRRRIWPP